MVRPVRLNPDADADADADASMDPSVVNVMLTHPKARVPIRSGRAAGYDVHAVEDVTIEPGGRALLPTGLRFEVPSGHYMRVAPRSGLALKHGVHAGAGVIDEDYRGEVKVLLFNHGDANFSASAGDRIAQLIFERISTPALAAVARLDDTARGEGGFGSTGK